MFRNEQLIMDSQWYLGIQGCDYQHYDDNMKKTMMIKMPTVEGDIGADGQEVNDNNMITIVTPVEVAPTLVHAIEWEYDCKEISTF